MHKSPWSLKVPKEFQCFVFQGQPGQELGFPGQGIGDKGQNKGVQVFKANIPRTLDSSLGIRGSRGQGQHPWLIYSVTICQ